MRTRLPLLAACLFIPTLGAPPALAQPAAAEATAKTGKSSPQARAAELVQRGTELHAQGQLEPAAAALEGAWRIEKTPATAALLGEWEVKLARWVPAAKHLAFALQEQQAGPERDRIELLFKQARAQVGGVKIVTSIDGADIFAGTRVVGQTPIRGEVFVEPGEMAIVLKKTSVGEVQQVVKVAKGGAATVHLEPSQAGADDSKWSEPEPEQRSRAPIFLLTGVALIEAGSAIGLRVAASSEGAKADGELAALVTTAGPRPCGGSADSAACKSIKDRRTKHDTFANVSTGLFVLSGAALAASITYALWPTRSPGADRAVAVLPAVSPSASGLLVRGAF